MGAREHKKHGKMDVGFAVVTVSDTRTKADDTSGALIKVLTSDAGHRVTNYTIVKDEKRDINRAVEQMLSIPAVDALILCGGTGISPRDVTIETARTLFEKELPGFGELFRAMSVKDIGSAAMMSRATAGVIGKKVVFCIPGSRGAVNTAMKELILEECGHILWELRR